MPLEQIAELMQIMTRDSSPRATPRWRDPPARDNLTTPGHMLPRTAQPELAVQGDPRRGDVSPSRRDMYEDGSGGGQPGEARSQTHKAAAVTSVMTKEHSEGRDSPEG